MDEGRRGQVLTRNVWIFYANILSVVVMDYAHDSEYPGGWAGIPRWGVAGSPWCRFSTR